ncbi:MAG: helix-turn-helix domain-containing protein, partial [Deltaproteobacteria bacterium]|nr:helix-turn-helix domain-containing protein [Deltaproteobacteria bacterium]
MRRPGPPGARPPAGASGQGVRVRGRHPRHAARSASPASRRSRGIGPGLLDHAAREIAAIHEQPRTPHSVRSLCERSGASARTLRHAFQQRFGVSPRTYLQALRLNGARHELRTANPSVETVTRVAQRWGFTNS